LVRQFVLLREAKSCAMGRSRMRAHPRADPQTQEKGVTEYGDIVAVGQTFGIRERKAYELFNQGRISAVLLRNDGHAGVGSSHSLLSEATLSSLEARGDAAPKSDG
jgi:hypothetical protein